MTDPLGGFATGSSDGIGPRPLRVSVLVRLRGRAVRRRVAAALAAGALLALLLAGTGYDYEPYRDASESAPPAESSATVRAERARLRAEVVRATPRSVYLVVDRANNRLYLRRGERILLDAVCSSGSGSILRDSAGNREWVFDTPSGVFRVRGKKVNPAWSKPDWAFIEEGLPVPRDAAGRIEYGSLGEYALDLGDGYLIHGTLYERLLGRSVTHGCIRLGRDDLRTVYRAASLGTPVYIF